MVATLVVDDDARISQIIAEAVESRCDRLQRADSGRRALQELEERRYDVVILDIVLPPPDGITICRTLREQGRTEMVLMMSGSVLEPDERADAIEAGADDFVTKPLHLRELLARFDALARRAPERPDRYMIADLDICRATKTVERNGDVVKLTDREFSLLDLLASTPRELRSRREILDRIWGRDAKQTGTNLDMYISRLRKKIDIPHGRGTIETIRGKGFRLNPEA